MKNRVLSLSLALAMMGGTAGIAHADLLTYFNFNDAIDDGTTPPPASQPTVAFQSDGGLQSSTITTGFTNTRANITAFGGTTVNGVTGETNNEALTFLGGTGVNMQGTGGNNGNSFQFSLNTLGYSNVDLSYATRGTSTGFNSQTLSYSIDGGANFTNIATNNSVTTSFVKFDPGTISGVDNQSSVIFRFTLTGATNTTGNNRFDNIQVNAIMATPEPETWAMMALGVGALAMFSWKRKKSAEEASFGGGLAI